MQKSIGFSHEIVGESDMNTRHSVLTVMAHCCVWYLFCTIDWRYKDEYRERTGKELHFRQFPADKKRKKEWIDYFRRQIC